MWASRAAAAMAPTSRASAGSSGARGRAVSRNMSVEAPADRLSLARITSASFGQLDPGRLGQQLGLVGGQPRAVLDDVAGELGPESGPERPHVHHQRAEAPRAPAVCPRWWPRRRRPSRPARPSAAAGGPPLTPQSTTRPRGDRLGGQPRRSWPPTTVLTMTTVAPPARRRTAPRRAGVSTSSTWASLTTATTMTSASPPSSAGSAARAAAPKRARALGVDVADHEVQTGGRNGRGHPRADVAEPDHPEPSSSPPA